MEKDIEKLKRKLDLKKTLAVKREPTEEDVRKVFTLRCDKDFKEELKTKAGKENKTLNQFIISKLIRSYSDISPFSFS